MTLTPDHSLLQLALHFDGGAVPDWVQLTPAGPDITGMDGRRFRLSNPEAVVAVFNRSGRALAVDINHASEIDSGGTPVPAQGWIEEIENRDGALWGKVAWTDPGRALMAARGYRYLSPALIVSKKTREVVAITSAGLVHSPNLNMTALNSQQPEITDMDPAILEALGLITTATTTDAVSAITALKADTATALNSARAPDPELFVPRADHEVALNSIAAFQAEEATRSAAAMNTAVDAAVAAGKIAPASRDYHLETCKSVGLEKFASLLAGMPVIAGPDPVITPNKPATPALNEFELAVCASNGWSAEDFIKTKNEG